MESRGPLRLGQVGQWDPVLDEDLVDEFLHFAAGPAQTAVAVLVTHLEEASHSLCKIVVVPLINDLLDGPHM